MNTKEKEKLIEIEEDNVKDSLDSLKNQEIKNLGLLAFIGGILPFLFDSLSQTPICIKIIILTFSFIFY